MPTTVIQNDMKLTDRIQKAINTACTLHAGQTRKGDKDLPYISHPFCVAWILADYTNDEDIIIASLLHDVLEDVAGYYYEDIEKVFGADVTRIVRELSEDKNPNVVSDDRGTWEYRKKEYLANLEKDSEAALFICAADKMHNLQTMIASYEKHGDSLWERFNAPFEKQLWFYQEILNVLKKKLNNRITNDYERQLEKLLSLRKVK